MNKCLYCGISIPELRYDSLGRKLTKSTKYCSNAHRNKHIKELNIEKYQAYYREYYQNNKDKYGGKK